MNEQKAKKEAIRSLIILTLMFSIYLGGTYWNYRIKQTPKRDTTHRDRSIKLELQLKELDHVSKSRNENHK